MPHPVAGEAETPLYVRYNDHQIHMVRSLSGTSWFNATDIIRALGVHKAGAETCNGEHRDCEMVSSSDEAACLAGHLLLVVDEEHRKPLGDVVTERERALYGSSEMTAPYVDLVGMQTLTRGPDSSTEGDYTDFVRRAGILNAKVEALQRRARAGGVGASGDEDTGNIVSVNVTDLQMLLKTVEEMNRYMNTIVPRAISNGGSANTMSDHRPSLEDRKSHGFRGTGESCYACGTGPSNGRCEMDECRLGRIRDDSVCVKVTRTPQGVGKTIQLFYKCGNKVPRCSVRPEVSPVVEREWTENLHVEGCETVDRTLRNPELELVTYLRRALSRGRLQGGTSVKFRQLEDTSESTSGSMPKTYELKVKRLALQFNDFKYISLCPSVARVCFKECSGVCDLEALAAAKTLNDLRLDVDGGVKHLYSLKKIPSLKALQLHYHQISDDEFRCLCLLEGLEELTLRGAWNLRCLTPILTLRRLRVLDLSLPVVVHTGYAQGECSSDDELGPDSIEPLLGDVSPLAEIPTLEELNLRGRGEVETGVDVLGYLPRLRVLNLSGTGITDSCFEGLSASRSLLSLDMSFCWNVNDVSRLAGISTLKELKLQVPRDGIRFVCNLYCLPLRVLHLVLPQRVCNHQLEYYSPECDREVASLTSLADMFPFEGNAVLEELSVRGQGQMSLNIDVLSSLSQLRVLDISGISISTQCLDILGVLKGLVKLGLTVRGYRGCMNSLANITSLEELDVRSCSSADSLFGVAALLPALRVLCVSGATVTPGSLQGLGLCKRLVKLHLSFCRNVEGGTALPTIATLEELGLRGCQSFLCAGVVKSLPSLRVLNVKNMYVCEKVLKEFRDHNVAVRYRC